MWGSVIHWRHTLCTHPPIVETGAHLKVPYPSKRKQPRVVTRAARGCAEELADQGCVRGSELISARRSKQEEVPPRSSELDVVRAAFGSARGAAHSLGGHSQSEPVDEDVVGQRWPCPIEPESGPSSTPRPCRHDLTFGVTGPVSRGSRRQ